MKIKNIRARKVLNSRGNFTIEVILETPQGIFKSQVPGGASTGKYEAKVVSVEKAIKNIKNIISKELRGKDVTEQEKIDKFLIPQKFGANATTGVSLAVCRAGAKAKNLPLYQYIANFLKLKKLSLPFPSFNIINGGLHAGNELDFQEFMIVPQEKIFSKNLFLAVQIYHKLKKLIKDKFVDLAINVGDEGGFAPPIVTPEEGIDLILEVLRELNCEGRVKMIIDVASSQFYQRGKYKLKIGVFDREKLAKYYLSLVKKYPLLLGIEDPFGENDWEGWSNFYLKIKKKKKGFIIIGDDLLVTNPKRIKMAQKKKVCNGAIIKINQIGTLSQAISAVRLAQSFGWKIVVSHRSGETTDDFIADFAVGVGADFIKTGAPARGERVVKYNRLLEIEEELKKL